MISIGIYISKNSLCFAEMSLKKARPELHSLKEYFFDKQKSQEEQWLFISSHLSEIEKKYKGENLRFCYGLPQSHVTSFFIEFPFKEKFKILKTLPFEIEDQSPFDSNKVLFDARICKIEDKNKSSALCFITPEENAREFLELGSKIKKTAYLLSCDSSALANLLESWNKPLSEKQNPGKADLYVYLGVENSQLLLYKEGHLLYSSVLDWSLSSLIKEMREAYKLSIEKTWKEFFSKAFILTSTQGWTKEQKFFSQLIKKHIQLLIPKLKLLKMSLESQKNTSISSLALFGPGSVIKNLSAFLTAEMSLPVSRLEKLESFPQLQWNQEPSSYIAMGLALEGLKSTPYPGLNFLQSLKKESFFLFPKKWKSWGAVALLCLLIFSAYAFIRKQESFVLWEKGNAVFLEYGKKIALLRESKVNTDSLESFLKKEKAKLKSEQFIKEELLQSQPIDHLQLITEKLQSAKKWSLSIHYLRIKDRDIEIKGWIKSSLLPQFKKELESLAKGSVKIHSEKTSEDLTAKEKAVLRNTKEDKKSLNKGLLNSSKESLSDEKTELSPDRQTEGRTFFSLSFQIKKDN